MVNCSFLGCNTSVANVGVFHSCVKHLPKTCSVPGCGAPAEFYGVSALCSDHRYDTCPDCGRSSAWNTFEQRCYAEDCSPARKEV